MCSTSNTEYLCLNSLELIVLHNLFFHRSYGLGKSMAVLWTSWSGLKVQTKISLLFYGFRNSLIWVLTFCHFALLDILL